MKTPGSSAFVPYALSALRLVAALSFTLHGTQKLIGWPPSIAGGHGVALFSQLGVAGLLETVGGLLLLAGFLSRPVALLMCAEMVYAYFTAHAPRGVWPVTNGGELATLYTVIWLLIAVAGPGPWSFDAIRGRH
jgi:putative oxidoreductase